MNQWITTVFVEQPLISLRSAKDSYAHYLSNATLAIYLAFVCALIIDLVYRDFFYTFFFVDFASFFDT